MSLQSHIPPALHSAHDLLKARAFGSFQDLPIAAEWCGTGSLVPKIFLGRNRLSLFAMNEHTFMHACLMSDSMLVTPVEALCSANKVHFDESDLKVTWSRTMNAMLLFLMKKHGFQGIFKYSLRELRILAVGAGMRVKNPDDAHVSGAFSSILVELPFANKDGLIHATREGRTESFNWSTSSRDRVGFLHWFHDTSVILEPITQGLRACLLYDVLVDLNAALPLTVIPGSTRMKNLEFHVQTLIEKESFQRLHPKTSFLPLVRVLLYTYKTGRIPIPAPCFELYLHVVNSYRMRIRHAMDSLTSYSILLEVLKEGVEVVESFGGKTAMRSLLGPSNVDDLIRHIESLRSLMAPKAHRLEQNK